VIPCLVMLVACKHLPPDIEDPTVTKPSYISVTLDCQTCNSGNICAVTDDIIVSSTTTYTVSSVTPSGMGSFTSSSGPCYVWIPNNPTSTVSGYILACNESICDTTYFDIKPAEFMGIPCNPDTVYFERDILPLISKSCAYSGCHDAVSKKDGVVLDKYTSILKEVKAGNPSNSDLYEAITETSANKIMPPPPATKLPASDIALIKKWILQGARNNRCDEKTPCDTLSVSYASFVKPAIAACVTCHRTGNAGGGINLDSYDGVKASTLAGKLVGSIAWRTGYKAMPQGGAKLPSCEIEKITAWVNQGAKNN
jgi:hypothetical protein